MEFGEVGSLVISYKHITSLKSRARIYLLPQTLSYARTADLFTFSINIRRSIETNNTIPSNHEIKASPPVAQYISKTESQVSAFLIFLKH